MSTQISDIQSEALQIIQKQYEALASKFFYRKVNGIWLNPLYLFP